MKFLRAYPVFSGVMLALVAIVLLELWMVYSGRRQERDLEQQLAFRLTEIERLQRQKPAPNDENLRRVRDELEQTGTVLSTMLQSLNVVGADELDYFRGEPDTRVNAYFDIAQFVELMRKEATDAGVGLKPDESFGFSTYHISGQGPEPEYIRSVYRQRRIVENLLRALFAARPRALIAVQRETPAPLAPAAASSAPAPGTNPPAARPAGAGAAPSGGSSASGPDIFTIDPQVSARTPGYVDTMAFRIVFSGQTAALRGFMNALAEPEIPLVVRSVEVEPHVVEAERGPRGASAAGGPPASLFGRPTAPAKSEVVAANVPIVAENDSRFTVTIEFYEVK